MYERGELQDVVKSGQDAAMKELAETMAKAKEMADKEEAQEASLATSASAVHPQPPCSLHVIFLKSETMIRTIASTC